MVDSPRFNSRLANRIEAEHGGVDLMLLTHTDDVADHQRWKERFPSMRRVIHSLDVRSEAQWPYIDMTDMEVQLEGDGPWELAAGCTAHHTPGHSRGHLSFLLNRQLTGGESVLFTGDHLAFNARLNRLDGFARYGWSVPVQTESIRKCATLDDEYTFILPGHGRRMSFESSAERQAAVLQAAEAFANDPYGDAEEGPPAYVVPE